jgi:hypothetical protein
MQTSTKKGSKRRLCKASEVWILESYLGARRNPDKLKVLTGWVNLVELTTLVSHTPKSRLLVVMRSCRIEDWLRFLPQCLLSKSPNTSSSGRNWVNATPPTPDQRY